MLALLIDDAAHQRLVAYEKRGTPRDPSQRYATDDDFDDSDWRPPEPPEWAKVTT